MTSLQRLVVGKKFKEIQVPSESIYNLIPNYMEIRSSQPRYQSKYSSATRKFYETGKKPHQTMGFAKTPLKSPKEYLRKQTRDSNKTIERKPFTCLDQNNKKPAIPKHGEAPPILHEIPGKDFIKINAVTALKTPALKPIPKIADTRRGDSFVLEYSGLVPKFLRKEDFGKTPRYLLRRRQDLEYSNEMFAKSNEGEKLYTLSEDEKTQLIEGLRANWEEMNTRYLSLPLVIDTKVLQNRKLELEKKMNLLEHDISFLEKNKDLDIYVLPE